MRVNEIEWKQEMKWEKDYKNRPQRENAACLLQYILSIYLLFENFSHLTLASAQISISSSACGVWKFLRSTTTICGGGDERRPDHRDYLIMKFYWLFLLAFSLSLSIPLRCSSESFELNRITVWNLIYVELIWALLQTRPWEQHSNCFARIYAGVYVNLTFHSPLPKFSDLSCSRHNTIQHQAREATTVISNSILKSSHSWLTKEWGYSHTTQKKKNSSLFTVFLLALLLFFFFFFSNSACNCYGISQLLHQNDRHVERRFSILALHSFSSLSANFM